MRNKTKLQWQILDKIVTPISTYSPNKNNAYWLDYLRAYQFELDLESQTGTGDTIILQVTYFSPTAKRLSDNV